MATKTKKDAVQTADPKATFDPMSLVSEKIKVRVTLVEEMLGTLPSDPEIYRSYVASKADKIEEEVERLKASLKSVKKDQGNLDENGELIEEKETVAPTITVFVRDDEGNPCIYDYLVKGLMKNACKALRESDNAKSKGIKSYKPKIDNLIFVSPRLIKLELPENEELDLRGQVLKEGEVPQLKYCERPLRASTPQGERVALACSEVVPAGTTFEFTVHFMNKEWIPYVKEWLGYGFFNGFGQWHNGGKGRFTYEIIEE